MLVAGATGNLGYRICRELLKRGAEVRAIVRTSSDTDKTEALEKIGVEIKCIDFDDRQAIAEASRGVSCVVSAVAGLGDVIIDLQKRIADPAVTAGIPRVILLISV